ncbi:hypothetical protein B0H63DRAFT_170599 [Podospora didyma]|uniref:DUF1917-domain-containing protein n=1 Tax=Podospora didyma TaxID=330526 RepID=A0AAE0NNJ0_9PEZI|nr:hypothetical protein B0H63DRAFT_170599 [Podospora didyma]
MMDSDSESDFYGDEATKAALQARVDAFDADSWWSTQKKITSLTFRTDPIKTEGGHLHNRFEGLPGAWQLTESIGAFLTRLPPATTDWMSGLDWIRVANPYIPGDKDDDNSSNIALFSKGGQERLQMLSEFMKVTEASKLGPFIKKSNIAKERAEVIQILRDLAVHLNVLSGKWMLFPEPSKVNDVWATVVRATANNELGICAKVESRVKSEKERLICVYTNDFRDKNDIARVLNRMRELGLVRAGGKQIYYKCGASHPILILEFIISLRMNIDAWTHIGIYGGNEWNIPASMVSKICLC